MAIKRQPLTDREMDILTLVVQGYDNQGIADKLCLSVKTVGNRLITVYEKLFVSNRTSAALYAVSVGLCDMPSFD